jgi:hypothetical protein
MLFDVVHESAYCGHDLYWDVRSYRESGQVGRHQEPVTYFVAEGERRPVRPLRRVGL